MCRVKEILNSTVLQYSIPPWNNDLPQSGSGHDAKVSSLRSMYMHNPEPLITAEDPAENHVSSRDDASGATRGR